MNRLSAPRDSALYQWRATAREATRDCYRFIRRQTLYHAAAFDKTTAQNRHRIMKDIMRQHGDALYSTRHERGYRRLRVHGSNMKHMAVDGGKMEKRQHLTDMR